MLNDNIKKRRQWTDEETETLKFGVKKYGKHWSIIEKIYPIFKKNNRSQTDLKDKWRNIKGRKSPLKEDIDLGEIIKEIVSKQNVRKSKNQKFNKSRSKRINKSRRINKYIKSKNFEYTIYSLDGCPYCEDAKQLLKNNNIKYKEIKVNNKNKDTIYKKIDSKTNNYRYFPIIFKKNKFIGGFKELSNLL